MPSDFEVSDAGSEVGGRSCEQRGPSGVLLGRGTLDREDYGPVAGRLLTTEDVPGGVDGLHQKVRVVLKGKWYEEGKLSVGE